LKKNYKKIKDVSFYKWEKKEERKKEKDRAERGLVGQLYTIKHTIKN